MIFIIFNIFMLLFVIKHEVEETFYYAFSKKNVAF